MPTISTFPMEVGYAANAKTITLVAESSVTDARSKSPN